MREFKPTWVLDLGCGTGVYGHWLNSHGVEVVSVGGVQPHSAYTFPGDTHPQDMTLP